MNGLEAKPSWVDRALCSRADPEIFFPPPIGGQKVAKEALSWCGPCPVRVQCLRYALKREERGVWGGTTERQRTVIRRMLQQRMTEK